MNSKRMVQCFFLFLLSVSLMACSGLNPNAQRILFVGNSHTSRNNLPKMFEKMAQAGGHSVHAEQFTHSGWLLSAHAASSELLSKVEKGNWDTVVLQEQSVLPATSRRQEEMYPAARTLHEHITKHGAETMFFLTWGRQNGTAVQEVGFSSFGKMQTQVHIGYDMIADELGVPYAPVGIAWLNAHNERPDLPLWVQDGYHASEHGTYLATAVFYATFFNQSPEGLDYTAGLPSEDALFLQRIAAETVLANPSEWNLTP